jgi:hypothetical protein
LLSKVVQRLRRGPPHPATPSRCVAFVTAYGWRVEPAAPLATWLTHRVAPMGRQREQPCCPGFPQPQGRGLTSDLAMVTQPGKRAAHLQLLMLNHCFQRCRCRAHGVFLTAELVSAMELPAAFMLNPSMHTCQSGHVQTWLLSSCRCSIAHLSLALDICRAQHAHFATQSCQNFVKGLSPCLGGRTPF